jgi:hypothetical protein
MHGVSSSPLRHYLNGSTNVNDTFVGAGKCRASTSKGRSIPSEENAAIDRLHGFYHRSKDVLLSG